MIKLFCESHEGVWVAIAPHSLTFKVDGVRIQLHAPATLTSKKGKTVSFE
jgi:hypothetical protein